jgi:hypothetical protein
LFHFIGEYEFKEKMGPRRGCVLGKRYYPKREMGPSLMKKWGQREIVS